MFYCLFMDLVINIMLLCITLMSNFRIYSKPMNMHIFSDIGNHGRIPPSWWPCFCRVTIFGVFLCGNRVTNIVSMHQPRQCSMHWQLSQCFFAAIMYVSIMGRVQSMLNHINKASISVLWILHSLWCWMHCIVLAHHAKYE